MGNAEKYSCAILYRPDDKSFAEDIRQFQGCPTIALTKGGRIYVAWYAGGTREPHMDNYNIIVYSDDDGASWSEPLLVIPSSKELMIHALDVQLFCDSFGKLHVFWVQNNVKPEPDVMPPERDDQPLVAVEGYLFDDFHHSEWETVCDNPDAENPVFSKPRRIDMGFLRCKPTVLSSGRWISFNYDQIDGRYGYSISDDFGLTYSRRYGAEKLSTKFDEAMAYQKLDGSVRMLARTSLGELAESCSFDEGKTWSKARLSGIISANSRFFVARTPENRILLIVNGDRLRRINMTVALSDDDGETWKYKTVVDERVTSYPDADFYGDKIYMVYDRERVGAKEILFMKFTEKDIINGTFDSKPSIVSKP